MTNDPIYYQCSLYSPTPTGKRILVTWLPAEQAKIGKQLYKKDDLEDKHIYIVYNVNKPGKLFSLLKMKEGNHLHQRKASDI